METTLTAEGIEYCGLFEGSKRDAFQVIDLKSLWRQSTRRQKISKPEENLKPEEWVSFCKPQSQIAKHISYHSGSLVYKVQSVPNSLKMQFVRRLMRKLEATSLQSAIALEDDIALEKEFTERADRWQKQTGVQSSPTKRYLHEDYQIIMAMGEAAIPLILKRLKTNLDDWFWALKHLARGHDAALGKNNFADAAQAWLAWGRGNGYVS